MIRVLLIGDPSPIRETLRSLLSAERDVRVVGEAALPELARSLLACGAYDAVFFDSRPPSGASGVMELASAVRRDARSIFVVEPNEGDSRNVGTAEIDYLELPVSAETLRCTLERLRGAGASIQALEGRQPLVPVKIGTITRLLRTDEIRLVASQENYTLITLMEGERVFVRRTMCQWQGLLPTRQFARVHRGLFVNLEHIARVERTALQPPRLHFLKGVPAPLEVKRRHWPALRMRLELCRAAARPMVSVPDGRKSIGVLPFANLSRDPAMECVGDGVSAELIHVLAKSAGLRVASHASAVSFKGQRAPVGEVARELGVDYIVEGSVRRAGRRVRITAQLIAAADGFQLWSENFEREMSETLALQDEIAAEIAANVRRML